MVLKLQDVRNSSQIKLFSLPLFTIKCNSKQYSNITCFDFSHLSKGRVLSLFQSPGTWNWNGSFGILSSCRDFVQSQVLMGDTWDIFLTKVLVIMWNRRGYSDFFHSPQDAENSGGFLSKHFCLIWDK